MSEITGWVAMAVAVVLAGLVLVGFLFDRLCPHCGARHVERLEMYDDEAWRCQDCGGTWGDG